MATRTEYREQLKDKIVGLEDEGYGDFEFEDTELDTYLDLALARLYPAVYQRLSLDDQSVAEYGSRNRGAVTTTVADKVFMVEDATEREPIYGWRQRPTSIQDIDLDAVSSAGTVNIYYHDAWAFVADEVDLPASFTPLLILGALIEALESRHDTGVRGEAPPTGPHQEVSLIDRLQNRYEQAKADMAMALPVMVV